MEIHFQIYKPPKSGLNKKLILIWLLILVYLITILIIQEYVLLLLSLPLMIYANSIYTYRSDPSKYLNGRMIISSDFIEIDAQKYFIEEIEDLEIDINGFDGMVINGLEEEDTIYLNGTDNSISFKKTNVVYDLKFYIKNASDYLAFKDLFHEWYLKKIPFKESSNKGCRTYCMEHLNYRQIQDFKAKYK